MKKELTIECIFDLLKPYKIESVAQHAQYTTSYLYSVRAGKTKMSDELRKRLCDFLVASAVENIKAVYGGSAANLLCSVIAFNDGES